MVMIVRPVKGGSRVPVGGYNLQVLWQDLGGRDVDLRYGPADVDKLKALNKDGEHPGIQTIIRMIRQRGEVTVSAEDDVPGGVRWQ